MVLVPGNRATADADSRASFVFQAPLSEPDEIVFLADDRRHRFEVARIEKDRLIAIVPLTDFALIARASKIEYRCGGIERELTDPQRAAMRDFVAALGMR